MHRRARLEDKLLGRQRAAEEQERRRHKIAVVDVRVVWAPAHAVHLHESHEVSERCLISADRAQRVAEAQVSTEPRAGKHVSPEARTVLSHGQSVRHGGGVWRVVAQKAEQGGRIIYRSLQMRDGHLNTRRLRAS